MSIDCLSNECVKMQPASVSGYHFGTTPQYTVPKVWAVRNFPPGCDRNAPKFELIRDENPVVSISKNMTDTVVAYHGNGPSTGIESCSDEAVDGLIDMEENEELDKLARDVLSRAMSVIENKVETSHARLELSKDVETSEMAMLKKVKVIQCDELSSTLSLPQRPIKNGSVEHNITPLRKRFFAVRDFPPFCGRNAPKPTKQDL